MLRLRPSHPPRRKRLEAEEPPKVISGETDITLNVNGQDYQLRLAPHVTLLHALRNELNLTGCKDVADTSEAGADTVMIDGKATYAGTVFAIACQGKKVLTVESLNDGNTVDEVVSGFVKHDALQCGFCTPGFVVAHALSSIKIQKRLWKKSKRGSAESVPLRNLPRDYSVRSGNREEGFHAQPKHTPRKRAQ